MALVTGTFAEPALREVAEALRRCGRVEPTVIVLNIQVAALMTADWIARKLVLPDDAGIERVIVPGYCGGDLVPVSEKLGVPVEAGPRDLRDLPELFGAQARAQHGYGTRDIEIIAEINHAAHLPLEQIVALAERYRNDGADLIDVGCDPLPPDGARPAWSGAGDMVRELRQRGHRVSIDTFHEAEIAAACAAGAELVLSVSAQNRDAAADWGCEVVVVPDEPATLGGLDETLAVLDRRGVRYRIDPVIEPIGFGFAASLGRYLEVRRRYPQAAMMMGVGNLSEMTGVDSAGVNALLIGVCQELGIRSVLTTEVINWARSSVRELDVARQLMHFAVTQRMPPKHLDDRLVMLRDPKLRPVSEAQLRKLATKLTDRNIRLFADHATGKLHAMNKDVHAAGDDPFLLFDELGIDDASHAFYLGYELAKAVTALTLGKNYVQDEALRWGMLTRAEHSHFERRVKGK